MKIKVKNNENLMEEGGAVFLGLSFPQTGGEQNFAKCLGIKNADRISWETTARLYVYYMYIS